MRSEAVSAVDGVGMDDDSGGTLIAKEARDSRSAHARQAAAALLCRPEPFIACSQDCRHVIIHRVGVGSV